MIVRLIPRLCDGLTDPDKCKVLLDYCDPSDSKTTCTVKLIAAHATHGGDYGWAWRDAADSLESVRTELNETIASIPGSIGDWYSTLQPIEGHAVDATASILKVSGFILMSVLGG